MKLNIGPLSQRNNKWARAKLGNGTGTISGWGCVLTCATMQSRYYGKDVYPLQLNDAMKQVGGFTGSSKNLWSWSYLTKIYPDIMFTGRHSFENIPADLTILDAQLEKKQPVILKVEADEIGTPKGDHFILCIGKEGNDYWVNDPWWRSSDSHPQQFLLSTKYSHNGSRKPEHIILGYRIYEGPIIEENDKNKDEERACIEIHKFQEKEKFGNVESAARAAIGAYYDISRLNKALENADSACKSRIETELKRQQSLHDREKIDINAKWQSRLDTAKNKIVELDTKLKNVQETALKESSSRVLFKAWLTSILKRETQIKGGENI